MKNVPNLRFDGSSISSNLKTSSHRYRNYILIIYKSIIRFIVKLTFDTIFIL